MTPSLLLELTVDGVLINAKNRRTSLEASLAGFELRELRIDTLNGSATHLGGLGNGFA